MCPWPQEQQSWQDDVLEGYKFHLDVVDGAISTGEVLTEANLHYTQATIPLEQQTVLQVHLFYDLMWHADIPGLSRRFGGVLIIKRNLQLKTSYLFVPAAADRYLECTAVERVHIQ